MSRLPAPSRAHRRSCCMDAPPRWQPSEGSWGGSSRSRTPRAPRWRSPLRSAGTDRNRELSVEPILTPTQMAEADQHTIAAGTPVEVLMQRAGHAVAWEVRQRLGATYGKRVVVVAGKGNNGGDGLIAADVLRGWGIRVDVFELEHGVPEAGFRSALARADLLVDGMFGTGFRGELEGDAALVARHSTEVPTVAVDIPSGVDGLTGAIAGEAVRAVVTVTFAAHKTGLVFEPRRSAAGD